MADENLPTNQPPVGQFLLYQTEDGQTRIECRFEAETIWLNQKQLAELFKTSIPNINQHLKSVFDEGELQPEATIKKYLIVQTEGKREVSRQVEHYRLDAILAVGFRVRSARGTQFRIWANQRLQEFVVKGFTMDDERLKAGGGGQYFEELLARIRDIRSSERVFWRKVLDIYAMSIDYDPSDQTSQTFFKTVQNKMHWAAHGHTAAEIVYGRADANQPSMGLTSQKGKRPLKSEVSVAKNYLGKDEIEALNRIVTAYLEFAELQALQRKPMAMADWIAKLDDFPNLSDRDVLNHAGKISHHDAKEKAESELETYRQRLASLPQPVDDDFSRSLVDLERIEGEVKRKKQ